MPRGRALTEQQIIALEPKRSGKRYDVADPGTPYLSVRVGPKKKVFVFVARFPGARDPTRKTIGIFPAVSLEKARLIAAQWSSQIALGIDPKAEATRLRREQALEKRRTFRSVMEDYLAFLPTRRFNRHAFQDIATLRHDLMDPARNPWLDKSIAEVTDVEIAALIGAIKQGGRPAQALTTFSLVKTFFKWAVSPLRKKDYGLTSNPLQHVTALQLELRREVRTVLPTTYELRAYWNAATETAYPYGPYFKSLILTGGVRKTALARSMWSQFDLKKRLWTIPKSRVKNGEVLPEHQVPLTDQMVELLDELLRNQPVGHGDYVFSTTSGQKPINGFGKAVPALRLKMAAALLEISPQAKLQHLVLHDTRKLVRTSLEAMDVKSEVCEAILGHSKKGIEGVYNLHRYLPQMRKALGRFCGRLMNVIDGTAEDFAED